MDDIQDLILLGKISKPTASECLLSDLNTPNDFFNKVNFVGEEVIAGSFMSKIVNPHIEAADLDIYFKNVEHATEWCKANHLHMTEIHHNMCNYVTSPYGSTNLIVGIPFEDPVDLISGFDIRACSIAYYPATQKVYYLDGALKDCVNRTIVYQIGARHVTVTRLVKYLKKGFHIPSTQKAIFAELLKLKPNRDQELLGGYI